MKKDEFQSKIYEIYGTCREVVVMVEFVREVLGDEDFKIFIEEAPRGALALLGALELRQRAKNAPSDYNIVHYAKQLVQEAKLTRNGNVPLDNIYLAAV